LPVCQFDKAGFSDSQGFSQRLGQLRDIRRSPHDETAWRWFGGPKAAGSGGQTMAKGINDWSVFGD